MLKKKATRRQFMVNTALTSAALIAAPYVRGAHAAGSLSIGFWDHWVPGANDTLTKLCQEWGEKEKVEVKPDYITSNGFKNLLTMQAEAQAKSGHDIFQFPTWEPSAHADQLEPVDDLMKQLIAANGEVNGVVQYLSHIDGKWVAVPAVTGTQMKPPHSRIDLFKQFVGMDIVKMYPAGADPDKELSKQWTWDAFLAAAEKCHKGGYPFGMPLGVTSDAVDWVGAVFNSYGSQFVDAKGNITVKSDATRQALEYMKKIVAFLPEDVFAWDDASNNRWLISGKGASIMNPPSAWAVAKRGNPQVAEQCWYMGCPAGPKGRFGPMLPYFWGIWSFSKNKEAAKSLLTYLWQRSSVEKLVTASQGYDLPSFSKLLDFKVWAEEGPPKGTLWHYPSRGDQIQSITAAPAPPAIAVQIYNQATHTKMVARITQGKETIDQAITWAEKELEGFLRT